MTTNNISTAAREYATRPADERFPSVDAMIAAAKHDKDHSFERNYNAKDLRVVPTSTHNTPSFAETPDQASLMLESPKGRAAFTHWSFGQLARSVSAPAAYLRTLPPAIAADALNFGLKSTPAGTDLSLLVKANGGVPQVRACTSDSYERVWDASLYDSIRAQIMGHDPRWGTPPTWTGESAGAYRGDRDSFLIIVNGGSIVTDPSLTNSQTTPLQNGVQAGSGPQDGMYRGLLVRNSEVGAAAIVIEQILFRYICGNHMLWGAIVDQSFRRRHVGTKTLRDTLSEISRIAYRWTNASAARDEAIIRSLIDHEIAHTKEAVIDELRKIGASKEDAERAYSLCEQRENASPRSFWGTAQGMTRAAQETEYQDERYQLDQLAAKILQKGRKLVAA